VIGFEDANPETAQGRAIFAELVWVHAAIRRDLDNVAALAGEVSAGLAAEAVQGRIEDLQTNGPLWRLKVNCLQYCRFVHAHHNHEDALFFPRLRAANPDLEPVVDKLEADHREVSDLLDEVEAAAAALGTEDDDATRGRVTAGLEALGSQLLAHLEYEEERAGPTIRRLTTW
jgi:hypothetical protein